jgi:predicted flap endonuclease-1-like 5' DNA nuclease
MWYQHVYAAAVQRAHLLSPGASGHFQATRSGGIPWWLWLLFGLTLFTVLLVWWFSNRPEKEGTRVTKSNTSPPTRMMASLRTRVPDVSAAEQAQTEPAMPKVSDDLKRIEGIGPKISCVLLNAGITSFSRLAATESSSIRQILDDAGINKLAVPDTWPAQAALAAAGSWADLIILQDGLKGGRRIQASDSPKVTKKQN